MIFIGLRTRAFDRRTRKEVKATPEGRPLRYAVCDFRIEEPGFEILTEV